MPAQTRNRRRGLCGLACSLLALASLASAQAGAKPPAAPLSAGSIALPKAFLREPYRAELGVQGGVAPFRWVPQSGALPPGLELAPDGVVSGMPRLVGDFPFAATVTDSSTPPHQIVQSLVLRVVAPLMAKWLRPPTVNGLHIQGAVQISNQTGEDFDLTAIVVAVNDIGRATVLGYEHFTLEKNTLDYELPFDGTPGPGTYQINVDVIGEIPDLDIVHHARLTGQHPLQVLGP